ncbi:coiled-coil domain-containing protein 154-like isoform X3 [Lineus longissimus]|uniref:coiled-coil domain-containing protein 154-like isoform X3 n=1 Tax=Lineus longissimus TaxID=88925 RepID=UPI00315D28F5
METSAMNRRRTRNIPYGHRVDTDVPVLPTTPQFPSKFSALPNIHGVSPQPNQENQLVPFGRSGVLNASTEGMEANDRVRLLETRIGVTEKSNRALLEEVVRLQSELKSTARRNEDVIRDERIARQGLENTLRSSTDALAAVTARLKRTEDRIQEERTHLNELMGQSKTLEQSVIGAQQDVANKRDYQAARIDELKSELEESNRAKNQLERLTFQLSEDVRALKNKFDNQSFDFSQVTQDLKLRSRKIEEEHRQTVNDVRRHTESQNQVDLTTNQLRIQIESKLSEVRDVLIDLRNKQDAETQERRMGEQQGTIRVNDLQASLLEQSRKRDEAIHALDTMHREKEHAAETERLKLQNRVAEMVEDVSKRILQKDIKLREETQDKFLQIEKSWHEDQLRRQEVERAFRKETEQKWETLKRAADEEIVNVREAQKIDRSKYNETLRKIDEAVSLLDQQIVETKKQMDKVIMAEIKSRKQHERDTRDRVDHLQDKIGVATATLQEAIGGVTSQLSTLSEKVRRDLNNKLDERQAAAVRQLNDLDTRLLSLSAKHAQIEDKLDQRVAAPSVEKNPEASAALSENMREKLTSVIQWQELTRQNIKELQRLQTTLPTDIFELNEKLALLKNDTSARIQGEIENRVHDVEAVRREFEKMAAKDKDKEASPTMKDIDNEPPSQSELEEVQGSIRKLAESIQTVKTVLGMKIQSEQKLRNEEVKTLEEDLQEIRDLIDPLLKNGSNTRLFIKPDGDMPRHQAEAGAPEINKWGLYSAVRWWHWKSKLSSLLEKEDNKKVPDSDEDEDSDDEPPAPKKDGANDDDKDDAKDDAKDDVKDNAKDDAKNDDDNAKGDDGKKDDKGDIKDKKVDGEQ